jgi:trehalose 6-phosphate synthase/phosphatase
MTFNYNEAFKRLIFLDYDSTLITISKYPEFATLDRNSLNIIQKLSSDRRNHIVIISGRDKKFLNLLFNYIDITLVAEHGYFIKKAGEEWKSTVDLDLRWKNDVKPILIKYTHRCKGTFVEEKAGSFAWHYKNADLKIMHRWFNKLRKDLGKLIGFETEFEIIEGNNLLEVKSVKYNKGQAANALLKNENYDFIFAAGHDKTDEFLFQALPYSAHTIHIGFNPSIARYNVSDTSHLLQVLEALTE